MGLVAMDNGESPGNQEPSSASNCSQSTARGLDGMESNGGTRSTVCGLRTMEPENNLRVFERGSLASTNTGAPNVMCLFIHAIWCAEKVILLFFIILSSTQKHLRKNPCKSGIPRPLVASIRVHTTGFVFLFNCAQRLRSSAMLHHLDLLTFNVNINDIYAEFLL